MKRYFIILSLALFSALHASAQGICDSIITIGQIPTFCQGADNFPIYVSHYGGVFTGPGTSNGTSSILNFENIAPGFHTVTYTVTGPGGCTNAVTRTFQVRDAEEATLVANGTIDCFVPGSSVALQASSANNNQFYNTSWSGPQGSGLVANGWSATTNMAGRYRFKALPFNQGACPAYAYQDVAFSNAPPSLAIENCTNCAEYNGHPPLRLKLNPVPPNWQASLKTPNGVVSIIVDGNCNALQYAAAGLWTAEIKNAQNGCKVTTTAVLNPMTSVPSVSSGSNLGIFCGFVGHFIAAMQPHSAPGIEYFWTTPDGSIVPASYGSYCPAPIPGLYILHGRNTFTGCESRDTSVATLAPTPVSSTIRVICDGESFSGHSQSGTYVDTLTLANGCPKIQKLKLIVLAPLTDSVSVLADNGTANGSIEYAVTQGWPPFTYAWSNGEFTSNIANLSAGTYTITVTDANNCSHIREIEVPAGKPVGPLKFRDAQPFSQARLFPNPSLAGQTNFTLELIAEQPGDAQLMLTDVLGRSVFTHAVQIATGKNVFSIAESLPEGVYTLLLKSNLGMKEVSKLVVTAE